MPDRGAGSPQVPMPLDSAADVRCQPGGVVEVRYPSGTDLLAGFWNAAASGGLALPAVLPQPRGAPVLLRVVVGSQGVFEVPGLVTGHLPGGGRALPRTYVEFASDERCAELLAAAWRDVPEAAPRAEPRLRIERPVAYGRQRRPSFQGRTHDISVGGACVTAPRIYPRGTRLFLVLDDLALSGAVRWALPGQPGRLGLSFDGDPLARRRVAGYLERLRERHAPRAY